MSDIKRFPLSELIPIDLYSYLTPSCNFQLEVFLFRLLVAGSPLSVVN